MIQKKIIYAHLLLQKYHAREKGLFVNHDENVQIFKISLY